MNNEDVKYAGFWIRFAALMIDSCWLGFLMYLPLVIIAIYDLLDLNSLEFKLAGVFFMYIFPAIIVLWLWAKYQSSPGKMALNLKVVDADTFEKASFGKYCVRYVGYYVSMIPLFLGYFWAGWNKKKKGFHDMMSNTVVIYTE